MRGAACHVPSSYDRFRIRRNPKYEFDVILFPSLLRPTANPGFTQTRTQRRKFSLLLEAPQ